ncbi:hypothetical protein [Aporhodopirellula aestuarii]|uniref:Uncharacterized protein n=1 Tax=Aporhodopirellula aestuarii TaxID=2950107 RepID=A0ABT0U0H8_9BACT|nr:hypothetical protein [Aporhodopirellula aestuarii]MCM2370256.1 hypothetical protein [Aporhodopirellula aestuarii]
MATGTIFYVGTEAEVGHHARPLMQRMPIRIAAPEEVASEAQPGDLAIFFSEHFERFRTAIGKLKTRNVATLYAIDGILEWRNAWENRADEPACPWTMRPVLCHKVACIGASQARNLSEWGNADKVEIVGIPRFDHLSRPAVLGDRSDEPFRLLVMTAKWPGFTPQQRSQITQSLIELREWVHVTKKIGERPIELIWRLTGGLEQVVGVDNELQDTTGEDLATALRRADATITTPSTAQLESMLLGKPTAILDYTNSPLYVGAAWRVTSRGQFTDTVPQLCDPPPERMHFQDCVLADALQREVSATDRMLLLIETMREIATTSIQQGQPIEFARGLLPRLANDAPPLPIGEIFAERRTGEHEDADALPLELADARREIKQLRATIDQLNKELGQAHAIFETIHKHPIAGPVVRTRERLLGWVGKSTTARSDSK